MKSILELIEASKEDLPDIYCDMDEVLVDFRGGAAKVIGGSFVDTEKKLRWDKINQTKNFWVNLDWMPGAKRLYQFLAKYDTHILSAYTDLNPPSRVGKMKWLDKNTKVKRANRHLVLRSQKQFYATTAGKPNVLIDDYDKNINEWEAKGGIGIHHISIGKTISELKRLGFK